MLIHLLSAALTLIAGNVMFRRFEPHMRWWQRVLKSLAILALTGAVSHFFGTRGVLILLVLALAPVIYIHAIWLPRHGVNGLTAEPKERYYALRGWKS